MDGFSLEKILNSILISIVYSKTYLCGDFVGRVLGDV